MAMTIMNNPSAMLTLGELNKNNSVLGKQLKKVSSGWKINSAGDDASGYAISERMRVQIRSLDQDERNTQNGASLLRVADGAVASTVEILRTMKEKAINAANDTNTDIDRASIQKEYDQLIDQIDDNANVTFNERRLVDGSNNRKVIATQTSLTNQSLSTNTTGQTAFSAMQNRQGENLDIGATDTVEISWVKNGETQTASVKGKNNIEDLIAAANATVGATTGTIYTVHGVSTTNPYDILGYDGSGSWFSAICINWGDAHSDYFETGNSAGRNWQINAIDSIFENYMESNFYNVGAEGAEVSLPAVLQGVFDGNTFLADDHSQAAIATGFVYHKVSFTWRDHEPCIGIKFDYLLDASGNRLFLTNYDDWKDRLTSSVRNSVNSVLGMGYASDYPVEQDNPNDTSTAAPPVFEATILDDDIVGVDASGSTVYTSNHEKAITIRGNNTGTDGQVAGVTIKVMDSEGNIKRSATEALNCFNETVRAENESEDNALIIHTGTRANQAVKVYLTDMRSVALGLKGADGKTLSVGTQEYASTAISVLDNALQKALNEETRLGSYLSRLDYTASNLTTANENVTASESTMRDADMAKEMAEYTKANVLAQAAQSMLAQANQNSSQIMSLLQ